MSGREAGQEELLARPQRGGEQAADGGGALPGLSALAATVGNQAFAAAARSGRVRPEAVTRAAAVARQQAPPQAPPAGDAPPVPEATRKLADERIAPELGAIADELEGLEKPTPKDWKELRQRVVAVRADFDRVPVPEGLEPSQSWIQARSLTAIARELIDQMLHPESDAFLRLAWGKTLGTCRQLVGILERSAPIEGLPSPAELAATMEVEHCPRIERAIAKIPDIVERMTTEEIEGMRKEHLDLPQRILDTSVGEEFGHVAAVEFQKGLELLEQATKPPGQEPAQIVERLRQAAERVSNLEGEHGSIFAPAPRSSDPAPNPNPLPPPPPPPIAPP